MARVKFVVTGVLFPQQKVSPNMFFIFQTSLILNLFTVNNAAFVFPQLKSQTVKNPPTQQFSSSEAGTMIVTLIYFILYQRNSLRNS